MAACLCVSVTHHYPDCNTLSPSLSASWLSSNDVCELEPVVQELLRHLVAKSTTGQLNLLLLMIREGLDTGKLRAGNYRVRRTSILCGKKLFYILS